MMNENLDENALLLVKYIHQKRKQFLQVCQFIAAFGFLALAVNWYKLGIYSATLVCVVVSALCTVMLFYRFFGIGYTAAGHISLGAVIAGNYLISVGAWHFSHAPLAMMTALPLAVMAFLGLRAALAWAVVCSILIASVSWTSKWLANYISWPIPESTSFFAEPRLLILLVGSLIVVYLIDKWANDLLQLLASQKKQLEQTQRDLMQTQRYKNHFFSSVSHEIRTPITAVRGIAELLLLNKHLDSEDTELVKVLHDSSSHLLTVVNDLLDLSKLEEDKLKIQKNPTDIREAVYAAYSIVRHLAQDKGLPLRLDMDANLPVCAMLDAHRLRQVLVNLLNNAIKFTIFGYVELRVNLRALESGQPVIHFAVEDTGPGIPFDKQSLIFQSYEQVSEESEQQVMGTGLGLTICKKLVELQNGQIGVHSELHKGSLFYFQLPLETCSEQEVACLLAKPSGQLDNEETEISPNYPYNLLLVEDNAVNILVAKKLLQKHLPASILNHAEHGAIALAYLESCVESEQALPQLILMDMHMPVMDGIEATKRIRKHSNPLIAKLPIVAMTANAFEHEIKKCLQAGMDDFVQKPFETQTLLTKIKIWAK